ncbi:hypothetical protein HRbin10_00520 [bacterium HR10]|uniref:Uncharacterized protein n=1 Tax=uncultured Acidobacteriota bacterium TaxID=171953 RepID=H5SCI5_9BACT|nr:hypothetical protein HGMM_F10H10C06 [uncultured Acidobacteriota bacterium]GBC81408.1 hypothetical protein HRbin10_00520 [bacterium HR10]
MAFIKDDSEASARLVEEIDRLVAAHREQGLRGFVVYIAGPEIKDRLERLATERRLTIPLTYLPKGAADPALERYRVDRTAANTVIVYTRKKAVHVATNVTPEKFEPIAQAARSIVARRE